MEIKKYDIPTELAAGFCHFLAGLVHAKKEVHIALSGGSTPKTVFNMLATDFQEGIDWQGVHLYWGDERCVPGDHAESNYKMATDHLISKIDIPKTNVHPIDGTNEPNVEAQRYAALLDQSLPKKNGIPCFDLLILGMGEDGHTVSIFPENSHLWHSHRFCEVARHPVSGQHRITFTGQVINNAATVTFLVTGAGKAVKVRQILQKKGDYRSYPAALVAPTSGRLFWFLDAEAASYLTF